MLNIGNEEPGVSSAIKISGKNYVQGTEKWVMLISLFTLFFVLLALYAAVLSVLLPNQIQGIRPDSKETSLAIVLAITSVFSTLTTPIAGALSDRTHTSWGRRTPWILVGALCGAACLIGVSQMTSLWMITLFWVGATIALNSMQAAVTTIIADRFSVTERGLASGFVGAAMTSGLSAGLIAAGLMARNSITTAYFAFAIAIGVVSVAFVVLNREPVITAARPAKLNIRDFFASFWISPREHPDFAWAFMGRFTVYMGYQAIIAYLLYILQDYIGLSLSMANETIATLSTITFFALVFAAFTSGYISDRIGRRKPFVFAASFIMGLALTVPLFLPTLQGMMIYAVLIGIGYGAFMSVDLALMTQVLPKGDGEATGKDLGILTTAVNIPQILSPVMAAWLLNLADKNYAILFIAAIAFVYAGSFLVLPIKGVR